METKPIRARQLIWVDWIAGAIVGVLVLSFREWLIKLFSLPSDLLLVMGLANLGYACFSFSLAVFTSGERVPLLRVVAVANILWGIGCLVWAAIWFNQASQIGLAQLIGEGMIVGGLGLLEWRADIREKANPKKPNSSSKAIL